MRSLLEPSAPTGQEIDLPMKRPTNLVASRWRETVGRCPCCGSRSHVVWGGITSATGIDAIYFVHWTEGPGHAAYIDLIDGAWGSGAQPGARTLVSFRYQARVDGGSLIPIDSAARLAASPAICGRALAAGELATSERADRIQSALAALWTGEPVIGELNAYHTANSASGQVTTCARLSPPIDRN